LKNVIERAVYQADSALITDIVFNPFQSPFGNAQPEAAVPDNRPYTLSTTVPRRSVSLSTPLAEAVREVEIRYVQQALREAKYNQRQAAQRLGLTYHQFRGLYRKYKDALTPGLNQTTQDAYT